MIDVYALPKVNSAGFDRNYLMQCSTLQATENIIGNGGFFNLGDMTGMGSMYVAGSVMIDSLLTTNAGITSSSLVVSNGITGYGSLSIAGPSTVDSLLTANAGITSSSLIVSNGITGYGSLSIVGSSTFDSLITARDGITTTALDVDNITARDITVETLHVLTIDDAERVSSVSTDRVRGGKIVAGTESTGYEFKQDLDVAGSAYIANNLGIGVMNPSVSLDVAGAGKFGGLLTASSGITSDSLIVSNGITGYGSLSIGGLATFTGGVTASSLTVLGSETVNGLLTASAGITSDSLIVSKGITGYGSLNIGGLATFTGLLTANGGIATTTITNSGDITVGGVIKYPSTGKYSIQDSSANTKYELYSDNQRMYFGEKNSANNNVYTMFDDSSIQIGVSRTNPSKSSYIDLGWDTTNGVAVTNGTAGDYALRLIRNPGANADSVLSHRGTGKLYIKTEQTADIELQTNSTARMTIASGGDVTINNNLSVQQLTANNGIIIPINKTLSVGGTLTASGGISTTTLSTSSTATTAGLLTASGGVSVPSGSSITANGGISTTTLSTSSTATTAGLLTANGGISTTTLTTSSHATINGNLTVTGSITGNITINNLLVTVQKI
jgi:hypothetical protein